LAEKELTEGLQTGQAAWLSNGLQLEGAQYVTCISYNRGLSNLLTRFELRSHVRKLGRRPTTAQKLELTKKRRSLKARITNFTKTAVQFIGDDAVDEIYEKDVVVLDEDVSEVDGEDEYDPVITMADPENQILPFPSAVPKEWFTVEHRDRWSIIADLKDAELELRQGHAANALDQVRTAVIHLSWEYKNTLRRSTSVVEKTRAWGKIKLLNSALRLQRRVYNHNRVVMIRIGDGTDAGDKFPFLDADDCIASTTVTNLNSAGQSSNRLTWLWRSSAHSQGPIGSEAEHETECEFCGSPYITYAHLY
jgi:hypothetical protein